ncbi:MAG: hypothetical protein JETT_2469 [Candidatus Jettenia ecosi]|uniref:Uncharacterized protein n=1 Tax=Candidatus Jettenia ecosi TaxID=2494326 RepID=A0A533Q9E3_9BACT|nr:MAG: hypothetical protein JETT_2469 [Candidatus Jettenia ecosi]
MKTVFLFPAIVQEIIAIFMQCTATPFSTIRFRPTATLAPFARKLSRF